MRLELVRGGALLRAFMVLGCVSLLGTAACGGHGTGTPDGGAPSNVVTLRGKTTGFTPCAAIVQGSDLHFTAWETDAPFTDSSHVQYQTVQLSLGVHFPGAPAPGTYPLESYAVAGPLGLCTLDDRPYCDDAAQGDSFCATQTGAGTYCNVAEGFCVHGTSTVTYFSVQEQSVTAYDGAIELDDLGEGGGSIKGTVKAKVTFSTGDTDLIWSFDVPRAP